MNKKNFKLKIVNYKLLILVAFLSLAGFGCNQTTQTSLKTGILTIGGHELVVWIADTDLTRQQGLSGRPSMSVNEGMLFIFDQPGQYPFWMKDMQFPLDFIWINQNQVIGIFANVPTEPGVVDASLHTYMPEGMFNKVLEVNANWATDNNIKVGDEVFISQPTNK